MNCPKCSEPLQRTTIRETEVDTCPICRGVWLDATEFEALLELHPSDLKHLTRGQQDAELNRATGRCPRHDKELLRVKSAKEASIVVDACPDCGGIWLDGGEFAKMLG